MPRTPARPPRLVTAPTPKPPAHPPRTVTGAYPIWRPPIIPDHERAARSEAAIRGLAREAGRLIGLRTAWAREAKRRKLHEEGHEELQQDVKEPTPGAPTERPSLLQAPEGGTAASSSSSGGGGTLPSPQATPLTPKELPEADVDFLPDAVAEDVLRARGDIEEPLEVSSE